MVVAAGLVLIAGTACANPEAENVLPSAGEKPAASSAPAPPAGDAPAGDVPGSAPAPGDGKPAPGAPAPSEKPGGDKGNSKTPPGEGPGEMALPPERIDGAKMPQGYPKTAAAVERTNEVAIRAQEGGCGKASAEVVEQSADQVTVKLVETTPRNKMACTMDIRYPTVKVALEQPLGERKLVLEHEQRKG